MVSCIILESEEEEDEEMTLNLRVGFKERQRMRLSEALSTAPSPTKRTHPEVSHEEPILDAPMAQVPPSDTVRSRQELVVSSSTEKDVLSVEDKTPIGHTLGNDINDKDIPINSLSWE